MKVLDRYLTRELFFPIAIISASLVFIFLIADLFDNLDSLISNKVPIPTILEYYLNLVPFSYIQIACWATWIGTVFLLIQLGLHNEMTAMKAAGLPITTIVKPILFLGFLIGIFVFVVSEWVVPPSYSKANEILDIYIDKNKTLKEAQVYKNLTYNAGDRLLIYFKKFSPAKNVALEAIILKWDEATPNRYHKMTAKKAHFNGQSWDLYEVIAYQTDSQGKVLGQPEHSAKVNVPEITAKPEDLIHESKDPARMSIFELGALIQKMKAKGIDVSDEQVQFYQRLALPWQSFLMIFLTLPILGTVRSRKALAGMVLTCLAVIFAYHVFGAVFTALGKSGKIWPWLGAWLHHAAFFGIMLFQLDRANHE